MIIGALLHQLAVDHEVVRGRAIRQSIVMPLIGLFLSFAVQAQTQPPGVFVPVDVEGLDSLSIITSIVQDPQGFIWFGGKNGLARFDGYEVSIYRHDPENPYSIGSDDVSDLLIDRNGKLWVSTLSNGGLNRYDPESGRFHQYKSDLADIQTIGHDSVYGMVEDAEGDIWLALHNAALNKLDVSEDVFTRFPASPNEINHQMGPSDTIVRDVAIDQGGIIWLATDTNGLDRFDPSTGQFTNFKLLPGKEQPKLHVIYVSRNGYIWAGSFGHGLFVVDQNGQVISHYQHDAQDDASLGSGMIWDVMEDASGRVWVATGGGDLSVLNPAGQGFARYAQNKFNPSTPSGTVTAIYQDNAGDFWFGSYFSSVDFLNSSSRAFRNLNLASEENFARWPRTVTAMARDSSGNLWMSTDRGLKYYDFAAQRFDLAENLDVAVLREEPIRALLSDNQDRLWVGTLGGGIFLLDKRGQLLKRYSTEQGLQDLLVWSIYEDSGGTIWVGTQSAGIARFDETTDSFVHFPVAPRSTHGLSNTFVWDIIETKPGYLWVATQWGLNEFEVQAGRFTQYTHSSEERTDILSSVATTALAYDGDETLWVGTRSGLNRIDLTDGTVSQIKAVNELSDKNLTSVLVYNDEVWFSSQSGLGLYNKNLNRYFEFDARHGVNGGAFVRRTGLVVDSDILAFGGADGVTLVVPDAFRQNDFVPPVVFTDFRIDHTPVEISEDGPLRRNIAQTKAIYLPPTYTSFSLAFSALSFRVPSENRYAYKLEGFDDMWHEVGSNDRRITYTNLDPGEYILLVKAANSDGLWNDSARALKIYIAHRWWQTWWAKTLFAALMVLGLYFALYLRTAHIRKRQALLKILVEKKTRELARANTSIRELNSDLEARVNQRTYELSLEVEERRQAEAKLYHMAFHDSLTELPNRYWLIQELKKRIERLHGNNPYRFALLFLDGDRFKQVNDTHGHLLGDQLLVAAANRLKKYLSINNHVIRLGGDEFTVLMDDVVHVHDAEVVARNIIAAFEKPFFIEQNKVLFQVSIGIVICEELYSKPEQILRDADIALYRAKDKGRGCYQIFDAQMREETIEANVLEQDLQTALVRDEMFLEYQPIVSLSDGKLMGFEALLRWNHPNRGRISPDKFIPIAEESNLIGDVGLKALELVCEQVAQWEELIHSLDNFTVAVNVSTLQVAQVDLLDSVDQTLNRWDVDGRRLKFEITETALMEKSDSVKTLLENLRSRGLELAIDDFGTGYSSLSYLDQLPVQILKIDRSFVSGLVPAQSDGGALEIVRATISMAHNLRMKVVAEGIETQEQLHILQAAGCDFGQGYWFAKPLPVPEAEAAIRRRVDMHAAFEVAGQPEQERKARAVRGPK